jgi:hypothetical protein
MVYYLIRALACVVMLSTLASCTKPGSAPNAAPATNAALSLESSKSAALLLPLEKQLCGPQNAKIEGQRSIDQSYSEMFAQGVAAFDKLRPVAAWLAQNIDNDARFTTDNVQKTNESEDYTGHFLDSGTASKVSWSYKEQNIGWSGELNFALNGCPASASNITVLDSTPDQGNPKHVSITYRVTESPTLFAEKLNGLKSIAPQGVLIIDTPSSRAGEHQAHARFLDATGWRVEDIDGNPVTYN